MSVGLQDKHSGLPLPGSISTTVINFSPQGACLILPKLVINGKHLFYSTLNSDRFNLLLHPEDLDGIEDEVTIAARSVWMDSCVHLRKPAFKVGIHFIHNQKELYNLFKQSTHS
ncbi:MAG: hypothetical protein WBB19_10450 [Desulforhopalus sp.]